MTNQHPITPPPELMMQWQEDWHHNKADYIEIEVYMATQAAQWGSDQELEACVEWLQDPDLNVDTYKLCAARRPKPPSLKEQALDALHGIHDQGPTGEQVLIIRRALEALPND